MGQLISSLQSFLLSKKAIGRWSSSQQQVNHKAESRVCSSVNGPQRQEKYKPLLNIEVCTKDPNLFHTTTTNFRNQNLHTISKCASGAKCLIKEVSSSKQQSSQVRPLGTLMWLIHHEKQQGSLSGESIHRWVPQVNLPITNQVAG